MGHGCNACTYARVVYDERCFTWIAVLPLLLLLCVCVSVLPLMLLLWCDCWRLARACTDGANILTHYYHHNFSRTPRVHAPVCYARAFCNVRVRVMCVCSRANAHWICFPPTCCILYCCVHASNRNNA